MDEDELQRAREKWQHVGAHRPDFAIPPAQGQESVWDYPRPPRLSADQRHVRVYAGDVLVAESRRAVRVLETGAPPTFYLPPQDVCVNRLHHQAAASSFCEWKGTADYFDVQYAGVTIRQAAWRYPAPFEAFAAIAGYFCFYPRLLACFVDAERVQPQPGRYYGGWVTAEVVGPFKGEPGTESW